MGVGKGGVLGVQTPPEIKDKTNLKYIILWIKFNVPISRPKPPPKIFPIYAHGLGGGQVPYLAPPNGRPWLLYIVYTILYT